MESLPTVQPGPAGVLPRNEMAARISAFDWSRTPLGPAGRWPASLRTLVDMLLAHPLPMILLWGPELVQIYNDAYSVIAGAKHPAALGQRNRACWPEALPLTEPIYQRVLSGGESVMLQDQSIPLDRHGKGALEEAFFTVSYGPCHDDDGSIGGIFVTVIETTEKVLAERERERWRAEVVRREALRQADQRAQVLDTALTHLDDFAYAFDRDGRFLYANQPLLDLYGLTLDRIIGKNVYDLNYPRDLADKLHGQIRQVVETKQSVSDETAYTGASGVTGHFAHVFNPVLNADGTVEVVTGSSRDVTRRVRADDALRTSELRFRRLVEHSPQSTQLFNPDGRPRQLNNAFQRLFGMTLDDLCDYNILGDPELVRLGVMPLLQRAFAGEAVTIPPVPYVPDRGAFAGLTRWAGAYVYPVTDESGRVEEVVLVHDDVTERKAAEDELSKFKFITENANESLLLIDAAGRIVYANRFACAHRGYDEGSLAGVNISELDPQYPPARYQELFRRAGQGRVPPFESVHRRRDGSAFPVEVTVTRVDVDAKPHLFAASRDISERVAAKIDRERLFAELESERNLLSEVFRRSPSFIAVLRGPRHTFELTNDRYDQLVGQRDLLGKPVAEALPELVGQGFIELLDGVYATGQPYVGRDTRLMLRRGPGVPLEERYLDFVYQPLRAADGTITGVFAHGLDMTESRRAETALRASEERYRGLFTAIDQGFCVIEVLLDAGGRPYDYRFVEANPAFERQTGLSDAVGRTALELVPGLEQSWFDAYGRVVTTGESTRFEAPADPMGRWFDVFAFRTGRPEDRRVAILFKDVTEAKRIEAALRESERRFRDMADTAPATLWVTEPDGSCSFLSRGWYELTGQTEETGLGFGWADAAHPDDYAAARDAFVAANAARQPYAVDFRVRRADGEYIWAIDAGRPRFGPAGEYLGMIGSVIDITDRKRAEHEREALLVSEQAARTEAERAGRLKDEFLATLSHELRTPLNAILGWSQILTREKGLSQDLADGLRTIERNARAQAQIIEDLLDMSRIISGKVRLDMQRVDLAALLREAVETSRPAADAKGVAMTITPDATAGPISGDPARLQQVLWNLLTNAVKFTPAGGRVGVRLAGSATHVEVCVIDTGEGIKPEFLPHVFDRFRQADATTTRRHGGLGLGLSIVKQLVELHGGSVRVASAGAGQGATFTVTLPLTTPRADPVADPAPRPDRAAFNAGGDFVTPVPIKGVGVLVVDDEPDARGLVKRLLEDAGACVVSAASAAEALRLLRSNRPDVLVTDIGMPGEDGYALIRQIRTLPPEEGGATPAVALTAYARAEDRVKAMLAGFQTHVPKPVEPAELITMVASLAGRT